MEAKVLQLPPTLCDDQVTLGLPKSVTAVATQVRLVVFGVSHPIEDLLRKHVVAKLRRLRTDLVEHRAGEEDWAVSVSKLAESDNGMRCGLIRLAMRCRLASSWNWFLTTGSSWKKPVLELDGSIVSASGGFTED